MRLTSYILLIISTVIILIRQINLIYDIEKKTKIGKQGLTLWLSFKMHVLILLLI